MLSKFAEISTAGENVNVEAPGKLSILMFMTVFLMNLCPSEKWGATSCSLVLHWHCPNFVLPQLVSTRQGNCDYVRRGFHSVRASAISLG